MTLRKGRANGSFNPRSYIAVPPRARTVRGLCRSFAANPQLTNKSSTAARTAIGIFGICQITRHRAGGRHAQLTIGHWEAVHGSECGRCSAFDALGNVGHRGDAPEQLNCAAEDAVEITAVEGGVGHQPVPRLALGPCLHERTSTGLQPDAKVDPVRELRLRQDLRPRVSVRGRFDAISGTISEGEWSSQ